LWLDLPLPLGMSEADAVAPCNLGMIYKFYAYWVENTALSSYCTVLNSFIWASVRLTLKTLLYEGTNRLNSKWHLAQQFWKMLPLYRCVVLKSFHVMLLLSRCVDTDFLLQ
jgi:hypothetical protein